MGKHSKAAGKKTEGGLTGGSQTVGGLTGGSSATSAATAAQEPAATAAPPAPPTLTPDQIKALNDAGLALLNTFAGLQSADTAALGNYNNIIQSNNHGAAVNSDTTNENMSGRGLGFSSIRDGALNDIASTLAQNNNIALTNYQTTLRNDQQARTVAQGEYTNTVNDLYGNAALNAETNDTNPGATGPPATMANPSTVQPAAATPTTTQAVPTQAPPPKPTNVEPEQPSSHAPKANTRNRSAAARATRQGGLVGVPM